MSRFAKPVFVAAGLRTPFGRGGGALAAYDAVSLSVPVVQAMAAHQRPEAEQAVVRFADASGKAVHTLVLPFKGFRASDERYQNYYRTDPSRPFCRRYIDPKLDHIRRHFSELALPEANPTVRQAIDSGDGS